MHAGDIGWDVVSKTQRTTYSVVRCLVKRYITEIQRKSQEDTITEDDINEVKKWKITQPTTNILPPPLNRAFAKSVPWPFGPKFMPWLPNWSCNSVRNMDKDVGKEDVACSYRASIFQCHPCWLGGTTRCSYTSPLPPPSPGSPGHPVLPLRADQHPQDERHEDPERQGAAGRHRKEIERPGQLKKILHHLIYCTSTLWTCLSVSSLLQGFDYEYLNFVWNIICQFVQYAWN